jgi:hypothetical protein
LDDVNNVYHLVFGEKSDQVTEVPHEKAGQPTSFKKKKKTPEQKIKNDYRR